MVSSTREAITDKSWWFSIIQIIFGCFLVAVAFVVFINPYDLVPGGVYGLALVIAKLFNEAVDASVIGYVLDTFLIIIALIFIGGKFGGRTIFAVLVTPGLMYLLSWALYPTREAALHYNESLLLGGVLDLNEHLLLASIIGGVFSGVGVGLVIRNNAATGGTDITGMLLHKFAKMKFANGVLLSDAIIVLCGLVVLGFGVGLPEGKEQPEMYLTLYSVVCIFVNAKVLGYTIDGASRDKLLYIICENHSDEMRHYILHDLNRGGTYLKAKGMYTDHDKEMIFLVVNRKEVRTVQQKIKDFDPTAFVVVTDAYDTFGKGFKPFPEENGMPTE